MRDANQWWTETKNDSEKLITWLKKQYHGEVTAAERIERYCTSQAPAEYMNDLQLIASQERLHARWVGQLLHVRGVEPTLLDKPERYWGETLGSIRDFESAAAVAAHAEHMRLERINVIADDPSAPYDIRTVFRRIRTDEMYHADAFSRMAGVPALDAAEENHRKGMEAIGLISLAEVL